MSKQNSRPGRRSFDQHLITIKPAVYLRGSGSLGRLLALLLLVICSPLIATLIFLVRIGSRGPGLFRQVRVGRDGKIFVMYKIRSMVMDAEESTGPVWTQDRNDPRITPMGVFLRKSHLDELPQLLNVVRGEMALFGPRPERPELVHILAAGVPEYLNRLAVRPGITGLAQINLPPDSDMESVRRKLQLDLEYIRHANFWLEFRMFLWTGLRLFGSSSSFATKLLRLNRNVRPVTTKLDRPVTVNELVSKAIADELRVEKHNAPLGETVVAAMRTSPKI